MEKKPLLNTFYDDKHYQDHHACTSVPLKANGSSTWAPVRKYLFQFSKIKYFLVYGTSTSLFNMYVTYFKQNNK